MRTRQIPIFPLPDAVLLPETSLPLHIFEPRYREMLADALTGEGLIGVQRIREGHDDAGRPAVYDIGCAGDIVEHELLDDGRSNIVLYGTFRYRIQRERESGKPYRIAEVTELPVEPLPPQSPAHAGPEGMRRILDSLLQQLAVSVGRTQAGQLPADLSDEGLVNEAATRLGLDADDRYRLLAMPSLQERYAWVLTHVSSLTKRVELLAPHRRPDIDPRWN